eukprot:m.19792 g.19792  ORF g.19792 m.19792 type:complete len:300 (+) comp6676_c0_seq1:221-1120(+)
MAEYGDIIFHAKNKDMLERFVLEKSFQKLQSSDWFEFRHHVSSSFNSQESEVMVRLSLIRGDISSINAHGSILVGTRLPRPPFLELLKSQAFGPFFCSNKRNTSINITRVDDKAVFLCQGSVEWTQITTITGAIVHTFSSSFHMQCLNNRLFREVSAHSLLSPAWIIVNSSSNSRAWGVCTSSKWCTSLNICNVCSSVLSSHLNPMSSITCVVVVVDLKVARHLMHSIDSVLACSRYWFFPCTRSQCWVSTFSRYVFIKCSGDSSMTIKKLDIDTSHVSSKCTQSHLRSPASIAHSHSN